MRLTLLVACSLPLWGAGCVLPPVTPAGKDPEVLIEQGRYRLALQALIGPDARSAYLRSKAEAGLGELEASLHSAEHALELEPSRAAYHVQVAAACGRLAEKASLLRQLGLAKRAKKELDMALQMDDANVDAIYGEMLYYYAAPSFMGGDKGKAEAAAETMTKLNAARGYLARAQLAKDRKDAAAEEAFYRKALEADHYFYEARSTLAAFLLTRDRAAAEAEACEAVQLDPQRASAWATLVEAAVESQCWNEMFERVAAARASVPESREVEYEAGMALVRKGMHYRWAVHFLEPYDGPNNVLAKAKLAEARGRIEAALASH